MPRPKPGYRKHSSGQARVSLNGKDYLLGTWGTKESRQKYNRLMAEWYASHQSKSFGVPTEEITILEVLAAYMKYCKKYYGDGPTSELQRIKPAAAAVRSLYGSEPASSFGPLQYKATREHIARTGNRSRQYVNRLCEKVKRLFRWAAAESLLPASIADSIGMVEPLKEGRTNLRETEEVQPVDEKVVMATLEHLPRIVADMVKFQLATGCRPGEVCSIQPGMVDRSGDVWQVRLHEHKNAWRGKDRTIYVGKEAQEILLPYLLRSKDVYCFSPKDSEKARRNALHETRITPLSCGNRPGTNRKRKPLRTAGYCYTTVSYGRAIQRACDKAFPPPESIKKKDAIKAWQTEHRWSPNQLRHTFATTTSRDHGLEVVSILLGHAKMDTTQIYAQADKAKAIEVTRLMG